MGPSDIKSEEEGLEELVSNYIGEMPFLWLDIPDTPDPASRRGYIEENSIALLSCFRAPTIDSPSPDWVGRYSDRERVVLSGLWNNHHVEKVWDAEFLDEMESWIEAMPHVGGM